MCKHVLLLLLALGFCATVAVNAATIVWVGETDDQNDDDIIDDLGWVEWLQEQGFEVISRPNAWMVLDANELATLNQADLVIVSRGTDSTEYNDDAEEAFGDVQEEELWNSITAPMILLNADTPRSNRWEWVDHQNRTDLERAPTWKAVVPGHSIFAGVALNADNEVAPFDASVPSDGVYHISGDVGNGTIIAQATNGEMGIVEWAPGVNFFDDSEFTATARRLLFTAGTSSGLGAGQGDFNLSAAGQQMFLNAIKYMLGLDVYAASSPAPINASDDVVRDVVLTWKAGPSMTSHDVYFGTDAEVVAAATRANPQGVLLQQGQSTTTYALGDPLAYGQIYYWRVDEVQGATVHKGEVWSFTVEPTGYEVPNVTVAVSIPTDSGSDPNVIVNGSGLDADGLHSNNTDDMWLGKAPQGEAPVLTFALDRVYKLAGMHVWNFNSGVEFILGFGLKNVTVETSLDGESWTGLGDFELERATSAAAYAGQTLDLGGVNAQYVRITANSNHGGAAQHGLSEVVFLAAPVRARAPEPADGAANVDVNTLLSWRTGREAVSEQVYLSTDANALADGTAIPVTAATAGVYDPGTLDLGATYFWRIDEVNEAASVGTWDGDPWSFSTQEYLVVDGFEGYYDADGGWIYEAWIDGFGIDTNGSQVGNDAPPYTEQDFIHGGWQAMPFSYNNSGAATVSEAKLTLAGAQDWTTAGIETLTLFFRGNLGNAAGQLYVKVNNTQVSYDGAAASLGAPVWKQWNVDLTALANVARNVTSLTIGVSGPGSGKLLFDDIRLYREAPPKPAPAVDPGTANLAALYAMENNVVDGSGNERDGTAQVGSSFTDGPTGYGRAIELDGGGGYVTLPIGPVIESMTSGTFATWVNWGGSGSQWCRVFDFGSSTNVNMFLTPNAGSNMRFAITLTSSGGESQLNAPDMLPAGWHHVAVVIDGTTMQMQLYLDGEVVASGATATLPNQLGNTTRNYLGRSQYADPYLPGSIDDFRIYNRALTEAEIRYLIGDR
ncbi:MAG: discoidin domain-containing protein [Sedimentisphaerales bacterium]|nr:discoidin domain-containing protein [Sedimentisphaerales bacterium]